MTSDTTYVYAALLDVLGYKYRLNQDKNTASLDFKDALQRAMAVLTTVNEADFNYQAISDTLVVTCSRQDKFLDFLEVIKKVAIGFLAEGLFVRGGVTYAPHFKSSHVTYSHAIARAYELESQLAIYPRIVVDHNIIEMFRTSGDTTGLASNELLCERNGTYFLNIIDASNWKALHGWARSMFSKDRNFLTRRESEFLKHSWFEDYLFMSPHAQNDFGRYIPSIRPAAIP